jgi:nucleotide-binding universal stress UspA family protein
METDNRAFVRELVARYAPHFPRKRYGRHYLVLRDEAERRFGMEDPKYLVKQCSEHREELQQFLVEARATLTAKGIDDSQISERYILSCSSPFANRSAARCSYGTAIAQEILAVLKEERFGTVVVGRHGVSKAEEFLFGSVSNKIIHHAKDYTVWVVA